MGFGGQGVAADGEAVRGAAADEPCWEAAVAWCGGALHADACGGGGGGFWGEVW